MSFLLDAYTGDRALLTLLAVLTQVTLICSFTLLAVALLRRRGAALRHQICAWAIAFVCCAPVLSPMLGESGIGLLEVEPPQTGAALAEAIQVRDAAPLDLRFKPSPVSTKGEAGEQSRAASASNGGVRPDAPEGGLADAWAATAWSDSMRSGMAPSVIAVVAGVWISGTVVMLLALLHGFLRERKLRRLCSTTVPGIRPVLADVRRALGADRLPPVLVSPLAGTPMALGFGKPVILLPRSLLDAPHHEIRDVLLHEMAHVIRHDHWMGLLQRFVAAAFWPHPLVHLVNRRLCRAREEICDNYVLRREDAPVYARVLLGLSTQSNALATPATASGLARPGWRLEERVAGLLDEQRDTMTLSRARTRVTVAILTVTASFLVVAGCNLRVASEQPPAEEGVAGDNNEATPGEPPMASTRQDIEQIDLRFEEAQACLEAGRHGNPDSDSNLQKAAVLSDEVIAKCGAVLAKDGIDDHTREKLKSRQHDATLLGFCSREMRSLEPANRVEPKDNAKASVIVRIAEAVARADSTPIATRLDVERINRRLEVAIGFYVAGRSGGPHSHTHLAKATGLFDEVAKMCDEALAKDSIDAAARARLESIQAETSRRRYHSLKMMSLEPAKRVSLDYKLDSSTGYPKPRSALRWSLRSQSPDGSWPSRENGGGAGLDAADTALMVISFLGAGHTEKAGKYKDCVKRALAYLRSRQSEDGSIGRDLWTRSLTTLALSEAYGMARVGETGRAAQKAIDALSALLTSATERQRQRLARGEWPDGPASMALAAMALHSGIRSGLRVGESPQQRILSMISDLDRDARTPLNAAAGLVIRQYAGYKRSDAEVITCAQTLAANLPRWEEGKMDFRYFYLGTLGMFKMGGDYWKLWNAGVRDMVIEKQIYNGGEHDGSWPQADVISSETATVSPRASRTYAFAMCTLTLEVYYRYLPIYR